MTLILTEGAVDAVKTYLAAQMATKLAAIDARYNDGITLDTIAGGWHIAALPEIENYPIGFVTSAEEDYPIRTDGAMTTVTTIAVAILSVGSSTEDLQRRSWRYGLAIVELLLAAEHTAGWEYALSVYRKEDGWPENNGGRYRQRARVLCQLSRNETD